MLDIMASPFEHTVFDRNKSLVEAQPASSHFSLLCWGDRFLNRYMVFFFLLNLVYCQS